MADLNALIAQGYQPPAPIDPFAQYAKMQQLNVGQNQNALAQYQLAQAQRQDIQANALNQAYASATNPETGAIDYKKVASALASGGAGSQIPAVLKNQFEYEKAQTEAQIKKSELIDAKLKQSRGLLEGVSTPQDYLAWHEANHADPVLGPMLEARGVTADKARAQIEQALQQPGGFEQLLNQSKLGVEKFAEMNKPVLTPQNLGGTARVLATPGMGGPSTVVPGSAADVTMTPFESARIPILQQGANAATTQANTSRAHLALSAITADPFNLTGAQAAFPLGMGGGGGLSVGGVTGARPAAAPAAAPVADTISGKQIPLGEAINKGLTGPELLAVMPKNIAGQVTAILEHRAAPPSGNTARASQLMQIVQAADPTYDAQQYKTKQGIEIAFTQGLPSRSLKSINVANDHLNILNSTIDALNNGNMKLFNQFGNAVSTQMSVPAPTDFNAVKRIVADELNKAVIGGVGALGDRKAIDETINAASGPVALRSVINRYQQLMEGQRNGLADQYKSGGGNNAEVLKLLGKSKTAEGAAPAASQGAGGFKYLGKE